MAIECASLGSVWLFIDLRSPEATLQARVVILRLALLALFVASAQGQQSSHTTTEPGNDCHCSPPTLQPFTGHVFDAETHKPIAGARIHYLNDNPPLNREGKPVRGVISGVVTSAQDGSFALPADLPLATYAIRVIALGYDAEAIYDSPRLVREQSKSDFPPRPSHEFNLRPSHDLVAIGASQLDGALNKYPEGIFGSASAFEPLAKSIVFAGPGPGLWHIDLNAGTARRIELPEALHSTKISITSIAWDGTRLLFICSENSEPPRAWIGSAEAPDFRVTLVPAPNPRIAAITLAKPTYGLERFKIEEGSDCDVDGAAPHCGQGGILRALDTKTGHMTTILQAPETQLSYLTDTAFDGIIIFAEDEPSTDPNARLKGSGAQFTTGLTLMYLAAGTHTHFELPGPGTRDIELLAEQTVRVDNKIALRVAYTVEGDCDPQSTDKAQPNEPSGASGVTPNNWSLCVVTAPLPNLPKSTPVRARAASSKRTR
jgi:hypothetical protein